MAETIALVAAWTAYFALHSLLAADSAKRWVARHAPALFPRYRLAYNVLATATAVPLVAWVLLRPGDVVWQWQGAWQWVSHALAATALIGFYASSKDYDMRAFLGVGAIAPDPDAAPFSVGSFHRYVRHPWYFFGLVLIWTRDMSAAMLASAIAMTLYFAIGSRLEENKLIARYGDAYRRYRDRVPGLVPRPWRHLSEAEARELSRTAADVPARAASTTRH